MGRARARHARLPRDTGAAVARVWQLQPAGDAQPDVVYAGVEPAALFRSDDGGESFRLDEGLWDHEHRPQWEPGGGGLCLHTVVPDPAGGARLAVAVSAAGFYRTLDGETWEAANAGIAAPFLPEPTPEFGQCVHKVDRHPSEPDTLFLQHHWGVYRSDDFGGTWQEIGADAAAVDVRLPGRRRPEPAGHRLRAAARLRRVPLHARRAAAGVPHHRRRRDVGGAGRRPAPGGRLAHRAARRLHRRHARPAGLYVGTRTGEVFASADAGETWQELARHLPPVLCVKTAVLR